MGYTPGVLTAATADMTVTLLLATARKLLEGGNFLAGQVSSDLSLLHFAELFFNPGNAALKAGQWSAWSPLWMCGWVVPGHITIMSMSIREAVIYVLAENQCEKKKVFFLNGIGGVPPPP